MIVLVAGLVLFLGIHSLAIVAPGWRAAQLARLGEKRWKGIYSLIAATGLILLIVGYGLARREQIWLYMPSRGLRHAALLVMLPVFLLLLAAYLPGRIRAVVKHPMLLATKLWAAAHLLANGTLADVLLFGGFVWAVADRIAVKRRAEKAGHGTPATPPGVANDAIAVVGGLAIYAAFVFFLHAWLIGVSPLG